MSVDAYSIASIDVVSWILRMTKQRAPKHFQAYSRVGKEEPEPGTDLLKRWWVVPNDSKVRARLTAPTVDVRPYTLGRRE